MYHFPTVHAVDFDEIAEIAQAIFHHYVSAMLRILPARIIIVQDGNFLYHKITSMSFQIYTNVFHSLIINQRLTVCTFYKKKMFEEF